MNGLNTFTFQGQGVRTFLIGGDPWFFASDVCAVLEIQNSRDALGRLDQDERSTVDSTDGGPARNIINEPGLYSLILGSRKPEAKAFKRWVTHEVLPAIRKTGGYQAPGFAVPQTLSEALRLAASAIEERDALSCTVQAQAEDLAVLEPKAAFCDAVSRAEDAFDMGQAAKVLKTGRQRLFAFLEAQGFIFRERGGFMPYQRFIDSGHFRVVQQSFEDAHHRDRFYAKVLITGKGMVLIQQRMTATQPAPLIRPQHQAQR